MPLENRHYICLVLHGYCSVNGFKLRNSLFLEKSKASTLDFFSSFCSLTF